MRSIATLAAALVGLVLVQPAAAQTVPAPCPTGTQNVLTGTIPTGTVCTLNASIQYSLDGEYYVDNGATLNIPAGTVIKGRLNPTSGRGVASVLVVQRGGTVNALGTAAQPIIFTSANDNLADPFDTNGQTRGLWGGVILLGNSNTNNGVQNIEGLPVSTKTRYGSDADFPLDLNDNSGTMRYVSIRHAGFTLDANAEINGLTMGAVGAGTTIEYIEVFANSDDSFEWFGGNVNGRYLVGSFSGDDDFDWDTGFRGKLQFLFSLKDRSGDVGRCIEGDGSSSPFTAAEQSAPVISNMTCVGPGLGSNPGGGERGGPTLKLRENTRGLLYNSVFTQYQTDEGGIDLEVRTPATVSTEQNFLDGTLDIRNNIFFDFSVGNTADAITKNANAQVKTSVGARNEFVSPGLISVGNSGAPTGPNPRSQDAILDPRPAAGAAAATGGQFTFAGLTGDAFFTSVGYRGAFAPAPATVWARGWTALDQLFYFSRQSVPTDGGPEVAALGLSVGPNPMRDGGTVTVSLDRAQDVTLALYDVLGRQVAVAASGSFRAGETPVALSTAGLPSGVYVLRLEAGGAVTTTQLSVVR